VGRGSPDGANRSAAGAFTRVNEPHTSQNPGPNPEAVAWYLARAETLLDDLRERTHSLRAQGSQLAGFSGAVMALVGANAGSVLADLDGVHRTAAAIALLSGTMLLVATFIVALRGANFPQPLSDVSVSEIASYTANREIYGTDLWRAQFRAINGLVAAIQLASHQEDQAAVAIQRAGRLFLGGLLSVSVSLCMMIVVGGALVT
jgi:hypothetical protein